MTARFLSSIHHGIKQANQTRFIFYASQPRISTHQCHNYSSWLNHQDNRQTSINSSILSGIRQQSRCLWTMADFPFKKFEEARQRQQYLFGEDGENYIKRLAEYAEDESCNKLVNEDVHNLIGLAQTPEHLDLLERIMLKLQCPSENFRWGSNLIRLYYKLGQIDRAVKNYNDTENFGKFFKQNTSAKMILTILFNEGRYEDVIKSYNSAKTILDHKYSTRFPPFMMVVATAAWAKIGTREAYMAAMKDFENVQSERASYTLRRIEALLAYMALINGDPVVALNRLHKADDIPFTDLKAMALLDLGRHNDLLLHLRRMALQAEKGVMLRSTFDKIRNSIKSNVDDGVLQQDLIDALLVFEERNLLDDSDLDSQLFQPLRSSEKNQREITSEFGEHTRQYKRDRGSRDYNRPPARYRQNRNYDQYNGRNRQEREFAE